MSEIISQEVMPESTLAQVSKMDGVKDLPAKQKVKFAKALMAEAKGNHAEAQTALDEAIAAG